MDVAVFDGNSDGNFDLNGLLAAGQNRLPALTQSVLFLAGHVHTTHLVGAVTTHTDRGAGLSMGIATAAPRDNRARVSGPHLPLPRSSVTLSRPCGLSPRALDGGPATAGF
jgi:hypothetical protein